MLGNGHYFDFRYPDFFAYLDTQTKAVQIIEVALHLISWKIKGVLSGSVTVLFMSKFTTSLQSLYDVKMFTIYVCSYVYVILYVIMLL